MKYRVLIGVLCIIAVVCVLFCILQASLISIFSVAIAFPFEQIGMGLRVLSLSSAAGNVAAFVIYIAVSLLPAAALLVLRKRRKLYAEDGLLGLLCGVIFMVLYYMINPGLIGTLASESVSLSVGKAVMGGMVYSVLIGYIILRMVRLFSGGGTEKLFRYMSVMLCLLNVLFVFLIFGAFFKGLLDSIAALQAGNVGNEHLLGATYVFLVLQYLVNVLPHIFSILIAFAALRLLGELQTDRYSAETVAAAERIPRLCIAALVATVLANIGFNLLQLLFAKSLLVVNESVQVPLFSIAFVLAALLLTRLVTENKQLKDDNDLFV